MSIIIDAGTGELPVIHQLAHQIWPIAFRDILSEAQISYMLRWMYSLPSLEEQLAQGHHFLLVKEDQQYQGYAAYEMNSGSAMVKLHKIYVLPSLQGKGAGTRLIQEVIRRGRENGYTTLQLNVNRFNKALRFYERLGFRITRHEDNDIGNGYFMNDFVMSLHL